MKKTIILSTVFMLLLTSMQADASLARRGQRKKITDLPANVEVFSPTKSGRKMKRIERKEIQKDVGATKLQFEEMGTIKDKQAKEEGWKYRKTQWNNNKQNSCLRTYLEQKRKIYLPQREELTSSASISIIAVVRYSLRL